MCKILDQAKDGLEHARLKASILKAPRVARAIAAGPDLDYASVDAWAKRVTLEATHRLEYGELLPFATAADGMNLGARFTRERPFRFRGESWTLRESWEFLARIPDEERETLRAIGKLVTQTSTYDTLICG